jgi:hypothetical protein
MRRAASILLGILLGAIATGIGSGIFLKKANDDRNRLMETVQSTMQQAADARSENSKAIEDANAKLHDANIEVAKAQTLIKTLQEEQKALTAATVLVPPSTKTIRGWSDVVRLDLGLSLKLPPSLTATTTTADELLVVRTDQRQSDGRALSVMRYDTNREREWLSAAASSTPVSFIIDGHLATGVKANIPTQPSPVYLLRIQKQGTASHLIWIREFPQQTIDPLVLLSTLRFES